MITQFYSEASFEEKVVKYLAIQSELIKSKSVKEEGGFYNSKNTGIINLLTKSKVISDDEISIGHELSM